MQELHFAREVTGSEQGSSLYFLFSNWQSTSTSIWKRKPSLIDNRESNNFSYHAPSFSTVKSDKKVDIIRLDFIVFFFFTAKLFKINVEDLKEKRKRRLGCLNMGAAFN